MRGPWRFPRFGVILLVLSVGLQAGAQPTVSLKTTALTLRWGRGPDGWVPQRVVVEGAGELADLAGTYTVLFSAERPSDQPMSPEAYGKPTIWPESVYRYSAGKFQAAVTPARLQATGAAFTGWPELAEQQGDEAVRFVFSSETGTVEAVWRTLNEAPNDVAVTLVFTAARDGWYSVASPVLATVTESAMKWACVPGYFQGDAVNPDFVDAYVYGQGIPPRPVVVPATTATTLSPVVERRDGLTLETIAEPGQVHRPWIDGAAQIERTDLGFSVQTRGGALAPMVWRPVLGGSGSHLKAGETLRLSVRLRVAREDWYAAVRHAARDVYRLQDYPGMKQAEASLTSRLTRLHRYALDDATSSWRLENFEGRKIGGQAYLGGVVGSDRDAMKNADYGAMWMMAKIAGDEELVKRRLPAARAFKLAQPEMEPGFFQGAARGQYYLSKAGRFTEEWGDYVEPIAVTYYVIGDLGQMLLFDPGDDEARERMRLGAERLLAWQRADGSWPVAFDKATGTERFTDLRDLRPTFYGALVAYRTLGDKRYLAAARSGADWYVRNAVRRGHFLGVCGDNRFVPDFASAQGVEALLELAEATGEGSYREAAVELARIYTTAIYTQPVPTGEKVTAGGREWADWQISQVGLGFEHGGVMGSANTGGPILLASHAGLFVRLGAMTGDSYFTELARSAALARDAFVDPATGVASYYWSAMNKGAGAYPHHAWWQIGWITDYLIAEAETRSGGAVWFPAGFMAPKVGPHRSYGFAPGRIDGETVSLVANDGRVTADSPQVELITAEDADRRRLFVVAMSMDAKTVNARLRCEEAARAKERTVRLGGWGIEVLAFDLR